jgi:hypothetical protein
VWGNGDETPLKFEFCNGCSETVLYECGTWSLIFREEHRLRVFEIKVMRRIFGPKGME